jgi:hypothetical protein
MMKPTPEEGQLYVRFLGDVRGILTHRLKKASTACPGVEECPKAIHRGQTRWKGYVAAEWWRDDPYNDWKPCVYEVTANFFALLGGEGLRGQIWRVERQVGEGGFREVTGEMTEEVNPDSLRPEFSVEPCVQTVYQTIWIAWDVAPLIGPPRVMLPSTGDPPRAVSEQRQQQSKPREKLRPFRELLEERRAKEAAEQVEGRRPGQAHGDTDRPTIEPSRNGYH